MSGASTMFKALQSQEFMRNPADQLALMREQGPLVQSRVPILGKVWLTTTQAATTHILKDDKNFRVTKRDGKTVGLSWWMPGMLKRLTHNMLSSDEPAHSRLRGIVDQAFHRRAIVNLEAKIQSLSDAYATALFRDADTADLVTGFARPIPLAVICELLGLPEEDQPKFRKWAQSLTTVKGVVSFLLALHRLQPLMKYIENRIDHEREHGGEGLIHELVNGDTGGETLTDDELVSMVFLLLLAGHETTTHLISGGVLALLTHPEQFQELQSDIGKIDMAVEECLRYVSPVQSTKARFVREDCSVEGVSLKAGDLVMPLLVASNFDPAIFDEPERFDISRKPNRHIEFGTGVHFCLGHQLARAEMKKSLLALMQHHKSLRLAVPFDEIKWNERFGLRSLKALPVSA